MRKIIITLLCLLTLPTLALAVGPTGQPAPPITEQTKPGELSIKGDDDKEKITLFQAKFEAFCGTNADVGLIMKDEKMQLLFAAKTPVQTYLIFVNEKTHNWALLLFPASRPDLACIAGSGEGFATDDRQPTKEQK